MTTREIFVPAGRELKRGVLTMRTPRIQPCAISYTSGSEGARRADVFDGAFALALEGRELVIARIGEQRAQQHVVERMPGLKGLKAAQDGVAAHVEIAGGVKHLVLYELVGIAQAFGVHDAVVIEHHGVLQRSA